MMRPPENDALTAPSWFALAVHARQEKAAARDLNEHGVEVFMPMRVERRMWSDRVKNVELALFPGYLFVRVALTAARRVELLRTNNVLELVGRLPGDSRIARSIPDDEIASLKALVSTSRNLDPVERLLPGKSVLIAGGPLRGARGVVTQEANGRRRLTVQIELLGRGVAVELSAEDIVETDAAKA